ncbi:hypothetical protein GGH92_009485, partial [Coemansia sp. RSA 2673]
ADIEMECSTTVAASEHERAQTSDFDSPQTAAESHFNGLKEGVESLAVRDLDSVVSDPPAPVVTIAVVEENVKQES